MSEAGIVHLCSSTLPGFLKIFVLFHLEISEIVGVVLLPLVNTPLYDIAPLVGIKTSFTAFHS